MHECFLPDMPDSSLSSETWFTGHFKLTAGVRMYFLNSEFKFSPYAGVGFLQLLHFLHIVQTKCAKFLFQVPPGGGTCLCD